MRKIVVFGLVFFVVISSFHPALAQDSSPDGLVYIVQEGDNLWDIAIRFGVSIDDLMAVNGIGADGNVVIGQGLVIPGFDNLGISGVLNTVRVGFGENLQSLSRRTGVPEEVLARLNKITSPAEIYAGRPLVVVENAVDPESGVSEDTGKIGLRPVLGTGQSFLELAVMRAINPWSLLIANQLSNRETVLPGQVLWYPLSTDQAIPGPGGLPDVIQSVQITPLPMPQGETVQIQIAGNPEVKFGGFFNDLPLNFFVDELAGITALQGIHALLTPGFYPLVITGTLQTGESFAFSQPVYVKAGNFPFDPVLTVSPETIDPSVTKPEDAQWKALTTPVTPEKYWQGKFLPPVPKEFAECYPSYFGNRRAYNDGKYDYFHTGLDFCGNTTTDVLAPAAGKVVFAGPLTVRGNATVIDHGLGVYTGYLHQSELYVKEGDLVEPGQVIGKIGATGRVTGPHLHWEVWVGGVQVDPLTWLQQVFPQTPETNP
jgi:murein DD-endopeptidase MepM/ murein hydrolase activator NlpD